MDAVDGNGESGRPSFDGMMSLVIGISDMTAFCKSVGPAELAWLKRMNVESDPATDDVQLVIAKFIELIEEVQRQVKANSQKTAEEVEGEWNALLESMKHHPAGGSEE